MKFACVFVSAIAACAVLGAAIPDPPKSLTWRNGEVNCFVYKKWRLTNGIYQSFRVSSAKNCYYECANQFDTPPGYYQCLAWNYDLSSGKCSLSQANCGNEPSIVANYVPSSKSWAACVVSAYDKKDAAAAATQPYVAKPVI